MDLQERVHLHFGGASSLTPDDELIESKDLTYLKLFKWKKIYNERIENQLKILHRWCIGATNIFCTENSPLLCQIISTVKTITPIFSQQQLIRLVNKYPYGISWIPTIYIRFNKKNFPLKELV